MQLKVGIIKDNHWVLEMTTDSPFVDEDGTIFGGATTIFGDLVYYLERYECFYLGNDCFLGISHGKSVVYNAATKQQYIRIYGAHSNEEYAHPCLLGGCFKDGLCSIYVENEKGTDYFVMIDRGGSVISSKEVNIEKLDYQTLPETP